MVGIYGRNKAKHADLLREKYQQYLDKVFSQEITSIENYLETSYYIYWDIPEEFKNEKEEYLNGKYVSFNSKEEIIYNLSTEKKMFNIGAGQLVVVE